MLGRAAYDNPCLFANVDAYFSRFGARDSLLNPDDSLKSIKSIKRVNRVNSRRVILEQYCEYLSRRYPSRCKRPACGCHRGATIAELIAVKEEARQRGEGEDKDSTAAKKMTKKEFKLLERACHYSMGAIHRTTKPVHGLWFGQPGNKWCMLTLRTAETNAHTHT